MDKVIIIYKFLPFLGKDWTKLTAALNWSMMTLPSESDFISDSYPFSALLLSTEMIVGNLRHIVVRDTKNVNKWKKVILAQNDLVSFNSSV